MKFREGLTSFGRDTKVCCLSNEDTSHNQIDRRTGTAQIYIWSVCVRFFLIYCLAVGAYSLVKKGEIDLFDIFIGGLSKSSWELPPSSG